MSESRPDPLVARMREFGATIFAEMSALAVQTGAVNLGQGFPDTDGPKEMLDAAAEHPTGDVAGDAGAVAADLLGRP